MMELLRFESPFACREVLNLWEEIFGREEALLETPQVDGTEIADNLDIVYTAVENGQLLGTIHGTIPRAVPAICGLSAMCTTPAARGKGVGRILFTKIVEEMEAQGVQTMFLGTGNPIAAKLYHSLGFSYLPGSHVMVRFRQGDQVDFTREYFRKPERIRIVPGSAALRIPIIPLVLHEGASLILDCNTGLVDCRTMAQNRCMSLYPQYMTLAERGGAFWAAVSEQGIPGAMASVLPTELGFRADFFGCENYLPALPQLLEACRQKFGSVYLQIAEQNPKKIRMAEELGFRPDGAAELELGPVWLPCRIFRA